MAFAKWQRTIVDPEGRIRTTAQVRVRRQITGTPLAILYSDREGAAPLSNPFPVDNVTADAIFFTAGGPLQIEIIDGAYSKTLYWEAVGLAAEVDPDTLARAGQTFEFENENVAPPSATGIRADNDDLSAATTLWVWETTSSGDDIGEALGALAPGAKSTKNQLWILDPISGGIATWNVDAVSDEGSYREITVSGHFGVSAIAAGPVKLGWMLSGADGASTGTPLAWSVANDDSDPGAGKIKANNDDLSAATFLYVSETDANTADIEAFLLAFGTSTNPDTKGKIYLVDKATGSLAIWDVTSVTDATDYVKVAVANHSGVTSLADDASLAMSFSPAGDAGFTPGTRLNFSTTTAKADPGAGTMRWNHATFASVTEIYMDDVEAHAGANIEDIIQFLDDVANAGSRGVIRFQHVDSPSQWSEFSVIGPVVDETGYWTIPVAPIDFSGTLPSTSGRHAMTFSPAGADGADGEDGEGTGDFKADGSVPMTGPLDHDGQNVVDMGASNFIEAAELTIVSGAITPTDSHHTVDTESDAASDNLDTITALANGGLLFLRIVDNGRVVVLKHNTGNIFCPGGIDVTLQFVGDLAVLFYSVTQSKWIVFGLRLGTDRYLRLTGGTLSGNLNLADNQLIRPYIMDYAEVVSAHGGTGGGTEDFDLAVANVHSATVDTSANTFTFSNPPATGRMGSLTLILTNGGSQTVNWPASVDWPAGAAPTLTAAGRDVLVFWTIDAGTIWYGALVGKAFA